ncbi:trichothecene 3-O-acetyltransferase [Rhodocollybia butyracea]|uniref:Trichothecene 3-O-acetyltransferase n=1 Tax=Rhodocollybia butyracea TaxID=206335 RepID=A0A9P5UFT8_9AGAR|nr:trichothecene 3-O-acetyltransferase [Rhodocollybia butyracea]
MKFSIDLNILEQQPGLNKLYTQICSIFPISDASSHPKIVETLQNGLERLSARFPWLAGQIINQGAGPSSSGTYKIIPFEKTPRLIVKDLSDDPSAPSMEGLRRANFPFTMVDESIIAPRNTLTLPGTPDESSPAPILLVQANFISGGLILTVVSQHSAMDMVGHDHIMYLLSKACHNEEFTSEELSIGNCPNRTNIIPLLDGYIPNFELENQMAVPAPTISQPAPPSTWAYFSFSPNSLATLKSHASSTLTHGYISTDDALSALLWQSVIRARLPRLDPSLHVKMTRAIDIRRFLDIPSTYPALLQNLLYYTSPLQNLVTSPLGLIASQLRESINPPVVKHNLRALATVLHQSPDKNVVSFTAQIDQGNDIMVSSWSKTECYEHDFNFGLGKPESVRRPRFDPVEGLVYFMPKRGDGEVVLGVCLRIEDMERLKGDGEFMRYAEYVG